jgi:hypothetical protein
MGDWGAYGDGTNWSKERGPGRQTGIHWGVAVMAVAIVVVMAEIMEAVYQVV